MKTKKVAFIAQCVLCHQIMYVDQFTDEFYEIKDGIPGRHIHYCPVIHAFIQRNGKHPIHAEGGARQPDFVQQGPPK